MDQACRQAGFRGDGLADARNPSDRRYRAFTATQNAENLRDRLNPRSTSFAYGSLPIQAHGARQVE